MKIEHLAGCASYHDHDVEELAGKFLPSGDHDCIMALACTLQMALDGWFDDYDGDGWRLP